MNREDEMAAAIEGGVLVKLPLGGAAPTFNLEKAVCSHGLFMMAPNHWDPRSKTLQRPLCLNLDDRETSYIVRVSQPPVSLHELHIQVLGACSLCPRQQHSLLRQVRRMLRLSEEEGRRVREFQEAHKEAKERDFGKVFRSPTLFEDMVKCILLCNCHYVEGKASEDCIDLRISHEEISDSSYETGKPSPPSPASDAKHFDSGQNLTSTSNDNCSPSPSFQSSEETIVNPCTRSGNFPSPRELAGLDEKFLAKRCNLGYRAGQILKLAQEIVEGKVQLNELEDDCGTLSLADYDKLAEKLKAMKGFGPFTCANVLMCMGFYHIIPTDSETIRHLKQVHAKSCTIQTVQREVELIYGKYAPFQFLAYWSEVWHFYEEWFGNLAEMPQSSYKLITAANMRPKANGRSKRLKL